MIRPQLRSTMPSQTCLVMLKHESRFVFITASQFALSIFLNVMSRVMPALFTRTSIGPTSDDDLGQRRRWPNPSRRRRTGRPLNEKPLLGRIAAEPLRRLGVARRVRGDDLVPERGELDADRLAQTPHAAGHQRNARFAFLPWSPSSFLMTTSCVKLGASVSSPRITPG